MRKAFLTVLIIFAMTVMASLSFAVPAEISYQGYLTDNGVPVDGGRNMAFPRFNGH